MLSSALAESRCGPSHVRCTGACKHINCIELLIHRRLRGRRRASSRPARPRSRCRSRPMPWPPYRYAMGQYCLSALCAAEQLEQLLSRVITREGLQHCCGSCAVLVVQEVAERVGTSLSIVPALEQQYSLSGGQQLHMRLGGRHQLQNASLAVALAAGWEAAAGAGPAAEQRQQQLRSGVLPAAYAEGIQTCEWPGRSQVLPWRYYDLNSGMPEAMPTALVQIAVDLGDHRSCIKPVCRSCITWWRRSLLPARARHKTAAGRSPTRRRRGCRIFWTAHIRQKAWRPAQTGSPRPASRRSPAAACSACSSSTACRCGSG